jgi:hypothetical protein
VGAERLHDPCWPEEAEIRATFTEQGGKTRITMESPGIPAGKDADMAEEGWGQSSDRLATYPVKKST